GLPHIPEEIKDILVRYVTEVESVFSEVDQFKINIDNPSRRRGEIVEHIKNVLGNAFSQVTPRLYVIGLLGGQSTMLSKTLAESEQKLEQIRDVEKAAHDVLTAVQQTAARTGVSIHETEFANEVEALSRARKWWLFAAGTLGLLALGVALFLTNNVPP